VNPGFCQYLEDFRVAWWYAYHRLGTPVCRSCCWWPEVKVGNCFKRKNPLEEYEFSKVIYRTTKYALM